MKLKNRTGGVIRENRRSTLSSARGAMSTVECISVVGGRMNVWVAGENFLILVFSKKRGAGL